MAKEEQHRVVYGSFSPEKLRVPMSGTDEKFQAMLSESVFGSFIGGAAHPPCPRPYMLEDMQSVQVMQGSAPNFLPVLGQEKRWLKVK